jgi:hypothetical protein
MALARDSIAAKARSRFAVHVLPTTTSRGVRMRFLSWRNLPKRRRSCKATPTSIESHSRKSAPLAAP